MDYKYLAKTGALNEAVGETAGRPAADAPVDVNQLLATRIPASVTGIVPESVARDNLVVPVAFKGGVVYFAAVDANDIGLADKLRFLLNRDVCLRSAPRGAVLAAIKRYYGERTTESVDSPLADFAEELTGGGAGVPAAVTLAGGWHDARERARAPDFLVRRRGPAAGLLRAGQRSAPAPVPGAPSGGNGVFYHVVDEGQRDLMRRPDGTMEVIVGPRRVWRGKRTFQRMQHHVAHPGEFLIVRFRDGRQDHVPGPADVWFDPRVHQEITREDALQLAAKEAVVVYSRPEGSVATSRRIEYGPGLYVARPGEWLHTFSWHASRGGSKGVEKIPNGLVFQKLWLMPDQMYHDVSDVRTSDDALLTIRLMIFFELIEIERMLDTTHDPIGDFVNAATSDVVAFVGRQDFDGFKRSTAGLNELETYRQLTGRAAQCGYRITKVVYRGYGAPASLQQMQDQAIEARTKLQLERATEQQAQDLENYKLDSQIARAGKRRLEQTTELEHDLEGARRRNEAELRQREATLTQTREQRRLEAEMQLEMRRRQDAELREHAAALRELGVDLTAYLTQARADRVIELRGGGRPHVHLGPSEAERGGNGAK